MNPVSTTDQPATEQSSPRTMVNTAAPLITMGTTWVVRKALMKGYEAATGKPAPVIHNREATVLARVLWAASMAATIASIEIVVWRILDNPEQ